MATTTQFTDDAYNKHIDQEGKNTTLIGNWYEEQCVRDATGEGRTVPQRHIKRSGLLADFTKMPSTKRVSDNTFDRVYGKRAPPAADEVPATQAIQLPTTGLRYERDRAECLEYAKAQMDELTQAAELAHEEREFSTTTADRDAQFPAPYNPGKFQKNSTSKELSRGPQVPKAEMYSNSGVDINLEQGYAQEVPVTFYTQTAGSSDPSTRSTMNVSCPTGISTFGRNAAFSTPVSDFHGHHQYEEVNRMMESAKFGTRHPKGSGTVTGGDTLALLKADILAGIRQSHGVEGLADLRVHLMKKAADNGCLKKDEVYAMIKELAPDCNNIQLDIYLNQLCTMKKNEIQVQQFFVSLQGTVMPNAIRARVHSAFQAGWRPPVEVPEEEGAFMQYMQDLYGVDPVAVEQVIP